VTPSVAVVLCTSGAERLAACLGALLAQCCDPASWEIVVVDFADDGEARRVAHALAPSGGAPRLNYVAAERGAGDRADAARRAAARIVHAGRIVVIDDDVRPEPGWLLHEAAIGPSAAPGAGITAAR
jgi:glycosyltransferase involved in cell wall biosynthesis